GVEKPSAHSVHERPNAAPFVRPHRTGSARAKFRHSERGWSQFNFAGGRPRGEGRSAPPHPGEHPVAALPRVPTFHGQPVRHPLGVIPTPPLTPAIIGLNQQFWSSMKEEFARLAKPINEKLPDAEYLGRVYSRALNYWGVQLQRNQRLDEARACFDDSQKLNAD